LLEAEVGEGALPIPVEGELPNLAVFDLEHVGSLRAPISNVEADETGRPAKRGEHQHAAIIEFDVLLGFCVELGPGAEKATPAVGHFGQPHPNAPVRTIDVYVLDLWVSPLNRAVVPAFPRRVERAHDGKSREHR